MPPFFSIRVYSCPFVVPQFFASPASVSAFGEYHACNARRRMLFFDARTRVRAEGSASSIDFQKHSCAGESRKKNLGPNNAKQHQIRPNNTKISRQRYTIPRCVVTGV